MLEGHIAMLDEQSTIQYEVRTSCPKPLDSQIALLRIGRKSIRATGHAWALQKGAPYVTAFNYYLNLILSGKFFVSSIRWPAMSHDGK